MQTKLTLRLESQLIANAKNYAEGSGKSLSQIVSDYFQLLQSNELVKNKTSELEPLPPMTQKLKGILKSKTKMDEGAYLKHLEEKYL